MAYNRKKTDEWTGEKWYREFFSKCCLPDDDSEKYAIIFEQNGMRFDMLSVLNKDLLKDMNIVKVGHIIEILRAAQVASSQEQRLDLKDPKQVQNKLVNLKSVVTTKNKVTRKESEVGGKPSVALKRSLPVEAPTLSVKMPERIALASTSKPIAVDDDEPPEKIKKSVFDRLGNFNRQKPAPILKNLPPKNQQTSPILKKNNPPTQPNSRQKDDTRGNEVKNQRPRPMSPFRFERSTSPYARRSVTPPKTQSRQQQNEPSFHVTMSMKLSNPLVTKVSNKQQKRNSLPQRPSVQMNSVPRRNSLTPDRDYYGTMTADQIEMTNQVVKQRLGDRQRNRITWNNQAQQEKKRVKFGHVSTKEIPAVAGTVPINTNPSIISRHFYNGSIAFGTEDF